MSFLPLVTLLALVEPGQTRTVVATSYHRTFSHAHPVVARIAPGETVVTKTIDAGGVDETGQKKSEPSNPLTGPFSIDGAEPGDALAIHIKKLRCNRDWGYSANRLGLFALTPDAVEHVYTNVYKPDLVMKGRANLIPWDIDRTRDVVRLREPVSKTQSFEFPARPMLGCIGVAPAGDFAPTSAPSGPYGGNLDYNRIGQGATVYLPVYHPGGLLFIGDGHALQADGEPTGTGIETSLDVEFTVEVQKQARLTGPRVETEADIISVGSQPEFASALDNGLKMATTDMVRWLTEGYGLEDWAAHVLIGYQGRYDVVTVAGSMALRIPKNLLARRDAPKTEPPPSPKDDVKTTAPSAPKTATIQEKTEGLRKIDGFVPLYWNEAAGKLFMEVTPFDREFLYQEALASGLGSNPVGLDRGQLGASQLVAFHRAGPKVLLVESNYKYRALTDRAAERRAVDESFAKSALWGFAVEAEEGGRVLVDATSFFLRDAHRVVDRLRDTKQGTYKLDESRSTLDGDQTKGFPRNTEVEALLTYTATGEVGRLVAETVASAGSITLRQRHSLIELPALGRGFVPRKDDPRVGVFSVDFYDFATPVTEPVERHYIARHRLVKKDPAAAVSDPLEPIVYYVDPGAPEPVRSALVEGASWWARAFESTGFTNAFRVEVLPADADPMDLRYNVIQWVHRSTRGWSYGTTVVDPRTGEILKGRVTLDSLRARQDALIGDALVNRSGRAECAVAAGPGPEHLAAFDPSAEPAAMILARIRQLSAHEVGHTLGFAHNFAASARDRASVMDYPAPLVKIKDGRLDLSDAYAKGIGAYDELAVKYAYSQFPPGTDEAAELDKIIVRGLEDGLTFIADADARPPGAAHPLASLWDNGDDPVAMLRHEMEVRRIGLEQFGLGQIGEGAPLSNLESKLLPLYLHHRYQLTAAVKTLGGVTYAYSVKEGGVASPPRAVAVVPAARQRAALEAVLDTLTPESLLLPPTILDLIPPRAFGREGGTAERFARKTGPVFDPLAAATIAADIAIGGLLQPERAARLIEFHARDGSNPDFREVIDALLDRTSQARKRSVGPSVPIADAVWSSAVARLIELAGDENASTAVHATASARLRSLMHSISANGAVFNKPCEQAALDEIERFLTRPDPTHRRSAPIPAPPGDPIGAAR